MGQILLYNIVFCLIFLSGVSSSPKPVIGNIVRTALKNEFPSVVSVGYRHLGYEDIKSNHYCTGTLITLRHVLTAAHCYGTFRRYGQVFGGSPDLRECDRYDIEDWITYNDWATQNNIIPESSENDIAIVTLYKNVDETKMRPASISLEENIKHIGLEGIIAGWGLLVDEDNTSTPYILRTSEIKIITPTKFEKKYCKLEKEQFKLPGIYMSSRAVKRNLSDSFSSEKPWTIVTSGDSGGPLFYNNILLAINIAVCPPHGEPQNQMIIHLGLNHYAPFFDHLIGQGLTIKNIHN